MRSAQDLTAGYMGYNSVPCTDRTVNHSGVSGTSRCRRKNGAGRQGSDKRLPQTGNTLPQYTNPCAGDCHKSGPRPSVPGVNEGENPPGTVTSISGSPLAILFVYQVFCAACATHTRITCMSSNLAMHSASAGECAIRRMFVITRCLNSRGIVIILAS